MTSVYVSNQYAENSTDERKAFASTSVPQMETALRHANFKQLSSRNSAVATVALTEMPVPGLLVLRAREDIESLNNAVIASVGASLPDVLGTSYSGETADGSSICIRWIAPDEWLLSCELADAYAHEQAIRSAFQGKSLAIVNVSGGFTALRLKGADALNVLKKSTPYDTHPANLSPGKVVNTVFAKAQVTLHCVSENHYEILVRRSFADYVWHWIMVAAKEYGLNILQPESPTR